MNYSEIIIISSNSIDNRIQTLFSVNRLIESGIHLEFWNVSALTFRAEVVEVPTKGIDKYVIDSRSGFAEKVKSKKGSNCLYIVYMNYCYQTLFCYRTLSKFKAHILYCVNGVYPEQVTIGASRFFQKDILKRIFSRLMNKTPLIIPAKYELLTSGKAALDYKADENTKIVKYNSTDYITAFLLKDTMPVDEKYIVFIDQYLPFHPDIELTGDKPVNAATYYAGLNLLFAKMERIYDCKVIVAAHPAALKYKECNYSDGRKVVFGKTGQLISGCIGVLGHCSTAVAFPVVFRKKMIMLTSNEIKSHLLFSFSATTDYIARLLRCPLINIDDDMENICFEDIDEDAYRTYQYDYLTNKETENIDNYEILSSIIAGRL